MSRRAAAALPPPLPRVAPPLRRRLRVLAWRSRFVVAAVCLGLAVATTVDTLRPHPPSGTDVLVAARDLPAGAALTGADVRVATVPRTLALAAAAASDEARAALVGRTAAVPVPAGMPLVPTLFAGTDLSGPPGTVVAAVHLADDALTTVLAPGDRVDLLAAPVEGGDGVTLARGALVLPSPPTDGGGGLLGSSGEPAAPLLVAVRPDEAVALAGAGLSRALFAVLVS